MTDPTPTHRGFVLEPTYRTRRGRAVVHLFGLLEATDDRPGNGFLVRDGRLTPHFYVLEEDADRARKLGATDVSPTDRVSLDGRRPVARVDLKLPSDTPELRDRLHEHGVRTFEADVRFAMRYLIDHGLQGVIEIRGEPRGYGERKGVQLTVFDDPELRPAGTLADTSWTPKPTVLSLDIETDPGAERVLSIALYGCGAAEVLVGLAPERHRETESLQEETLGGEVLPFPTEGELLEAFARRVRELDPDVLTGWNVVDFDLAVLARRAQALGVRLHLGRVPGRLTVSSYRSGPNQASVPGRQVLDGLHLLRGSFVRMDDQSLDAVAREVLGEGKTLSRHESEGHEMEERDTWETEESGTGVGRDEEGGGDRQAGGRQTLDLTGGGEGGFHGLEKAREILRLYREELPRFLEYNLTDARLVRQILDQLHLVELAVERSLLTGLPPDRISGAIAAFDFLYLKELGRRGLVARTVGSGPEIEQETHGGYVLQPEPGLYSNVLVLDFQSLYPSLIRTFQIDPLGHLPDHDASVPSPQGPIVAPNGAAFRRERGILTDMLDQLFPRRAEAKERGDEVAAYAIKILMNSFYGVLATPNCRFHDPRISNAITSFGREMLLWCKDRIEQDPDGGGYGLKVLYGDTDSLFIASGKEDPEAARRLAGKLVDGLNRDIARHVRETWGVDSRLELEFEKLYLKILLPEVRGRGGHGARKRYAGWVETEDGDEAGRETVFTGMEVVRRDWTDLAHQVQRELYQRLFEDRPVDEYLQRVVERLRAGELDELLVYRKGLRKDLDEYTSTTPPHVAAARKMSGTPGRVVAYVWTRSGPEPAAEVASELDYQHYVEKQIQPVAEPVLAQLGLEFAKVIGDDRQLDLF